MNHEHAPYLDIRFSKVRFIAKFIENTSLVRDKASAIRGGIGEMLLRANCIGDRKCEDCGFSEECLVQRIMYSQFKEKPEYMQTGDSVGYIISCENYENLFREGDEIEFTLTLFGRNIVYFSQYLSAVYSLGQEGIGKNKSRFIISGIFNMYGNAILDGNDIDMNQYKWQTIRDYVTNKKKKNELQSQFYSDKSNKTSVNKSVGLRFITPTEIKYKGERIEEFSMEAFSSALIRRLIILSYFEEIGGDYKPISTSPTMISQKSQHNETYRYSNRKNQKIKYQGITGYMELEDVSEEWIDMLFAGEIVHVGKNTSFGFGKYRVDIGG